MRQVLILLLSVALPSVALADRAALIAQMEAAGANEYQDERHGIEVNGCTVTTYRWRNVERGWVLWTSLTLEMGAVVMGEFRSDGEIRYFMTTQMDPPMAIMTFLAVEGHSIAHEKPFDRKLPETWEPSPRGDGSTHFIEHQQSVAIIQQGPGVGDKARAFTEAFIRYRDEYCVFVG